MKLTENVQISLRIAPFRAINEEFIPIEVGSRPAMLTSDGLKYAAGSFAGGFYFSGHSIPSTSRCRTVNSSIPCLASLSSVPNVAAVYGDSSAVP